MKEQTIPSHGEVWVGPEIVNPPMRRRLTRGNQGAKTKTYLRDQQLAN